MAAITYTATVFFLEQYSMTIKVVNSLIENCFTIVEFMSAEARSMRLSEIADRLALQRSGYAGS